MERRTLLKTGALFASGVATHAATRQSLATAEWQTSVSDMLSHGLIWCADVPSVPLLGREASIAGPTPGQAPSSQTDLHAVFLKHFDLPATPTAAHLHLFAFTRYRLYVNGQYIQRGPSRFQNQRPEYDTIDLRPDHKRNLTPNLRAGRNTLAVLVHRDVASGRIMSHEPAFTALLETTGPDGKTTRLLTDATWKATPERSFGPRPRVWSSVVETVDARAMPDWTARDFDASAWASAVPLDAAMAFPFWPRTTPLQTETRLLPPTGSERLPLTLTAGQDAVFELPRIAQVYLRLTLEATEATRLDVVYELIAERMPGVSVYLPNGDTNTCHYTARAGTQIYLGGDTFAAKRIRVKLLAGRAILTEVAPFEVRYPFERLGSFASSDPFLDRLWQLSARSLEILSEDAYVDCADRERVEWMDCSPPGFEVTRVMMAGPAIPGKTGSGQSVHSDPRLLKAMLRRTALTQRPDGMMKAHTCSERFDIHAIMEDRACDWVIGLRQYFDSTGDKALVRELWPALGRLLGWFDTHRTSRGLVLARDWEVWDNPLIYQICEAAGLNAFVFRALSDAAYLAEAVGFKTDAASYHTRAVELAAAFNKHLWIEADGTYSGGLFGEGSRIDATRVKNVAAGLGPDGVYRPTAQAALFALDFGLVPEGRRERTVTWLLANQDQARKVMSHYFLYRVLYALDQPVQDTAVLNKMRRGWANMVASPWQTTWEDFGGGSNIHIYGIVPPYFLSSYVLGVRLDGPVTGKRLLIDPRPGDLTHAAGVVETEFGPVPVAWQKPAGEAFTLNVTVPSPATATIRFPAPAPARTLKVNGTPHPTRREGERLIATLPPGEYKITLG